MDWTALAHRLSSLLSILLRVGVAQVARMELFQPMTGTYRPFSRAALCAPTARMSSDVTIASKGTLRETRFSIA